MQKTDEKVEAPAVKLSARARVYGFIMRHRRLTALFAAFATFFGAAGPASATTTAPDPGTSSLFDGAKNSITTTLIPAVVAIVLVGSLFWLGVRWYQKGKNAGNK